MMDWITQLDTTIIFWVQNHLHNPVTDFLFPKITALGDIGLIWILVAVCMLIFKKTRKWGIVLLAALALEYICNDLILKNLVQRIRPCNVWPEVPMLISRPSSYSFPSGHSASSFVSAATLYRCNKKWGIFALLLAALIAFSRVFLFVHFPSDVLVGSLLGLLVSFGVCKVLKKCGRLPQPL
jgi:undecaprenyl-diphosphatase